MSIQEPAFPEDNPAGASRAAGEMTLLEHLRELRDRLVITSAAILITTVLTIVFAERLIDFLAEPAKSHVSEDQFRLIYTKPFGYVGAYFRVGLLGGITLSMPIIVYEVLMYLTPALTPQEKRWIVPTVVGAALSFVAGCAFAYYVALPPAMQFLLTFGQGTAEPYIEIGSYIDFVTRMIAGVGATFETPLIIMFLARIGIVNYRKLIGWWRYAIVLAFVASAVITPTIDPVTQSLVAGPIILLYAIGIVLARLFGRRTPR
ncbi:MAG: twin-arginine translocase subunit TatC [Dehalococcoidia bacterium]|nr:twin-arginine translocase subunit TatC [Dehalococcoidia bacterium]